MNEVGNEPDTTANGSEPVRSKSRRHSPEDLDFVLDRLPPYLVVSWGFDALEKRARDSKYDITVSSPWRQDPETCVYHWVGLVEHVSHNHFRLYWRRDRTCAWSFDVFAQEMSSIAMRKLRNKVRVPAVVIAFTFAGAAPRLVRFLNDSQQHRRV